MDLGDLRTSKYLKKEDVGQGMLVTISSVAKENVALDGAEPEMKMIVHFTESEKPLVLNSTNGQLIAQITGATTDLENTWVGKKVVLYVDPSVSYGGKLVGGIRVRAPKPGSVQAATAAPAEDGLPF